MDQLWNKELVMFYNVENLFPPDSKPKHKLDPTISGFRNWNERKYQNKLHKISNVFRLIQEQESVLPMIIGLAEVYGEQNLKDLVNLDPLNDNYGIVHYDSLDERGVDTALLYDKRKLQIIDSEAISFAFEQENEKNEEYIDTTRDVLYSKLKYQEDIFNVFVLHLPSKRENDINKPKRDYILKAIKERIIILNKNNEACLVCGDFNENPTDENLKNFLYDETNIKILNNFYIESYNNKIFSTFHNNEGLLFDQIFLSNHFFLPSFSLKFKNATVFNSYIISNWDKKFKGRPFRTYAGTRYLGGYSDHFPVYITLEKQMNNK